MYNKKQTGNNFIIKIIGVIKMREVVKLNKRQLYKKLMQDDEAIAKFSIVMVISLITIIICLVIVINYSNKMEGGLADKVIRFHVVANSDSTQDQLLKQQVKDEIIAYMEPLLKDSKDIQQTRDIIRGCMPFIKEVAEQVVADWEKEYSIYVGLDEANFPAKSYGDVVLPAGEYEACRVIIGEGKGENWWCVMFPPLCYLDASTGVVPLEGKEQLEQELNAEEYNLITNKSRPYQIRFKLIDKVNALLNPSDYKKIK